MKKLKLLFTAFALLMGVSNVSAQASYNHAYTEGAEVTAGSGYFLYNIGAGQFLTNGLNYGTRATVDNSGRVLTITAATNGYSIATDYVSLNNRTESKSGFLTTNGYVDTGSNDADWVFTPVSIDGYTNAYTIKNSDTQYLVFSSEDCAVNVGSSTEDNYSYWLLIPKATRETARDYSHYLINTQMNCPWEWKTWSGSTENNSDIISVGGNATNRCGEKFHVTVDIYQEIKEAANLPKGRYRFWAQGFWRQDGSSAGPVLYANSDTKLFGERTGSENSMADASTSFSEGSYKNYVETFVNSSTLRVGLNITASNQWVIFDNFVLDYLGQCVMDYATELPAEGDMAADTWYYFDIAAAANDYKATATNLGNIICVTDGYTNTSATSGSVEITATNNSFDVQRYYVKSSSANNLVIAAASFSYTVGSATAQTISEGNYINSLSTFILTYGNAQTNDPDASFALISGNASLKKNGSEIATGTLTVDNSAKTVTATFADVTLEQGATDYSISIPASSFGYEGKATNDAVTVNFNTGIIADGVYYFKKKGEYKYLTRGGNYGTETVTDNFGLSFETTLQTDGTYYMKNVDHSLSANSNKYLNTYTDGVAYGWTIAAADGGYYLKFANGNYLTTASYAFTDGQGNTNSYSYQSGTTESAEAIVWELLSKSDYATSLTAKKSAEVSALATDAGIDAPTLVQLEAYLATNFGTTDVTSKITNPTVVSDLDGWTIVHYIGTAQATPNANGTSAEIWNGQAGVKQTISNLPAGFYKITVNATWRPGNKDAATRVGAEANTTAWIYASTASENNITQMKSWYEGGATINSRADFVDNAANYLNTVYVYVKEGEDLTIGIASPSFCVQPWLPFYNWTLTYYEAKATDDQKTALASAIAEAEAKTLGFEDGEYAPYNNVAALEALATAKAIDANTAVGTGVVAATTALTGATWTANGGEVNAVYNGDFALCENNGAMAGWVTDHSAGLGGSFHARAFVLTSGQTNYDKLATFGQGDGTRSCAYIRFDGTNSAQNTKYTYGATDGYTMPLKTGTTYKLTAKVGGWGKALGIKVAIVNTSDENIVAQTKTLENIAESGSASDYEMYFVVPSDGNYKLQLTNASNENNAAAISNIVLKSTSSVAATIGETGFTTFASSSALNLDEISGGTAFYASAVGESTITLTEATGNVPAGEGLILKGTAGDNVTIPVTATGTSIEGNLMVGCTAETVLETNANYWVLVSNGGTAEFQSLDTQGATIPAGKAYLNAAASARSLQIVFGDATGISQIAAENVDGQTVYNLAGQRVAKAKKGLYIVNGKKIVIK